MSTTRRFILLTFMLISASEALGQSARSTACIETVCLGDGVAELRTTRWIEPKSTPPTASDPVTRLNALGPYPGTEALQLIPKIPGICKYDPIGQWFHLEDENRFLVASATWVPSLDRQTQHYEVREIKVKYETKKSTHTEMLRRLCLELTRKVQRTSETIAAQCVKEAQEGFRFTSSQGDTLVDISGDSHNYAQIDIRLMRIDEWSEQPLDIENLGRELSKLPACKMN
jgi:hypothetical protein